MYCQAKKRLTPIYLTNIQYNFVFKKGLHYDLYRVWATVWPWRMPWAERCDTFLGSLGVAHFVSQADWCRDCMHFTDKLAFCHSRGVNHDCLQLPTQPDWNTIASSQRDRLANINTNSLINTLPALWHCTWITNVIWQSRIIPWK